MFNNWWKFKYLNEVFQRNSNSSNHRLYNIISISKIISQRNDFDFSGINHWHNHITQRTRRFFRDYAIHSKKIAKDLENYGKTDVLGTAYELTIYSPKEPNFEDKGKADNHLQSGYSNIIVEKNIALTKSNRIIKCIERLNTLFKTKIEKIVGNEPNWKLNNDTPPQDMIEEYYYFINTLDIFTEIFREIKNGRYKRELKFTEAETDGILYAHFDNDTNKMLMGIKINLNNTTNYKKEFERMMKLFIENKELKAMVEIHDELVKELHNNENRKKFNDSISQLSHDIVIDSKYLDGKCDECKFRKMISLK